MFDCSQPGRKGRQSLPASAAAATPAPSLSSQLPDVSRCRANSGPRSKRKSRAQFARDEAELADLVLTLDTDFHTRLRRYLWAMVLLQARVAS